MNQTGGGDFKKCILVVDDTAIILTRISSALRDEYKVVTILFCWIFKCRKKTASRHCGKYVL